MLIEREKKGEEEESHSLALRDMARGGGGES